MAEAERRFLGKPRQAAQLECVYCPTPRLSGRHPPASLKLQFFDIKQLLVYSFGLQDQEFVVSYETEDLPKFSDLVQQLRSTEGRKYTSLDTPLIAAMHMNAEEFVG